MKQPRTSYAKPALQRDKHGHITILAGGEVVAIDRELLQMLIDEHNQLTKLKRNLEDPKWTP